MMNVDSPGGSFNEKIEDPDIKIISKPKILKKSTGERDKKFKKSKVILIFQGK